jgi:hypothetical protein
MIEEALRELAPGRYEAYEKLLSAIAQGSVWMLLWHGTPGSPDVQYGNLEVDGYGYAPCVTSAEELTASGWTRHHQVVAGPEVAAALYRERWGLWLNPHQPGGGVGIPWADLRRIAAGLDRLPAGPLTITPVVPTAGAEALAMPGVPDAGPFYARLVQAAPGFPAVRSLHRAWVRPSHGEPYVVIGLDLADSSPNSVDAVGQLMESALPSAPEGLAISTVAMSDPYDPVALWLHAHVGPFYDARG